MRAWKGCLLTLALCACGALGGMLAAVPSAAAAAVATTQPASQVTTTTATLNGTIDPSDSDSAYAFQYGTSPSELTHDTKPVSVGAGEQQVSASITDLAPDQTYYFQLVVAQGVGYQPSYSYGGVLRFMTMPAPATVATTGAATSVTATTAILNGVANTTTAASQSAFQYGTSTRYEHATALATLGPGLHALSAAVSGLAPNTLYHYRLVVVEYAADGTPYPSEGADRTFRTPPLTGRLSLASSHLFLSRARIEVPLICSGASGAVCAGRLTLSTRHARRTIACARGAFSLTAGHRATLQARISRACASLLRRARRRELGATLTAGYGASGQLALRRRVQIRR
jgi:phosphodiesterase/alkaline phosphatase D-like protein